MREARATQPRLTRPFWGTISTGEDARRGREGGGCGSNT